jgi:putative nucleotidyltransferase with HDIG domain
MVFKNRIAAAAEAEREGAWEDALSHYEKAFASLIDTGNCAEEAADLFRWIGRVHRQRGDIERALEAYETSLAIAECAKLPLATASALNCLAIVAQSRGDVASAEAFYVRARELADEYGSERLAALVDQNLGTLAGTQGDVDIAIVSYASALQRFRRIGDLGSIISALNNLGMAHRDLAEWEDAEESFDEAFELAKRIGDATLVGNIELNRAELSLKQNRYADSRDCCDRAFEIFTRVECKPGLGEAYKVYGALFNRMGKPSLADAHLEHALELAATSQDRLLEAEVFTHRAQTYLDLEKNVEALTALNNAHRLFSDLGARAALLDLNRRLDGLEETYLRVVAKWADSIDAMDPYTAGHCSRVSEYATRLAEAVGFTGRDLAWFRMGGYLHDVGKIAVPIEILNKPGKLTDEEFAQMKNHTVAGAEIVEKLNFPWEILPIVRNHHEKWNGTGYPDRLAGEEIPLTARILCVADVYDALTTARSYRPALTHDEAMSIMERDSGIGLDPTLFELFRSLLSVGEEQVLQLAAA